MSAVSGIMPKVAAVDLNVHHYSTEDLLVLLDLPPNFSLTQLNTHTERAMNDPTHWMDVGDVHVDSASMGEFLGNVRNALHAYWVSRQRSEALVAGEAVSDAASAAAPAVSATSSTTLAPVPWGGLRTHVWQGLDAAEAAAAAPPMAPSMLPADLERAEGVLNTVRVRTPVNVNVDSRFRPNYAQTSASNWTYSLPHEFSGVWSMHLQSMTLPWSFYAVSAARGNQTVYVAVNGGDWTAVAVPAGNYTPTGLVSALNAALTGAAATVPALMWVQFVYLSASDGTGSGKAQLEVATQVEGSDAVTSFELSLVSPEVWARYTAVTAACAPDNGCGAPVDLVSEAAARGAAAIETQQLPGSLGWMLGYRRMQYVSDPSAPIVSEGLVDVQGPRYVYLVVDDHVSGRSTQFYGMLNASMIDKPILARVNLPATTATQARAALSVSQNDLGVVTSPRMYRGPSRIRTLHIELLDEYGRALDLNHMDFSFCLTLERGVTGS